MHIYTMIGKVNNSKQGKLGKMTCIYKLLPTLARLFDVSKKNGIYKPFVLLRP